MTKKISKDQLTLPFGQPSELAVALRSIDWRATGLSEHCWRQVREICIAVGYCGSRDGCYATRETLLRIANDHRDSQCEALASLRTFERRHLDAVKIGLLVIERRYKKSAGRTIDVARLQALIVASRKLAQAAKCAQPCAERGGGSTGGKVADQWRISGGSTGGSLTKTTSNNSKQLPTTQKTGRQATEEKGGRRKAEGGRQAVGGLVGGRAVRQAAGYWPELAGRGSTGRDWQLLVKCCWLAGSELSEHWLHDALEGVRRSQARNRWALFWHLAKQGAEREGKSVKRLLVRLEVPGQYERPPRRTERLCAAD